MALTLSGGFNRICPHYLKHIARTYSTPRCKNNECLVMFLYAFAVGNMLKLYTVFLNAKCSGLKTLSFLSIIKNSKLKCITLRTSSFTYIELLIVFKNNSVTILLNINKISFVWFTQKYIKRLVGMFHIQSYKIIEIVFWIKKCAKQISNFYSS